MTYEPYRGQHLEHGGMLCLYATWHKGSAFIVPPDAALRNISRNNWTVRMTAASDVTSNALIVLRANNYQVFDERSQHVVNILKCVIASYLALGICCFC